MRPIPWAILTLFSATTAQAQRLGGAPDAPVSLVRVLAALVLCLAAAFGLALVVKAKGGKAPFPLLQLARVRAQTQDIEVIASRRLSVHAEIHIVRCRQVEYVLLCGANNQQVLERRDLAGLDAATEQTGDANHEGAG